MFSPRTGKSMQNWSSIAKWTVFGPLACALASALYSALVFSDLGGEALRRAMMASVVLPLTLGVPLFLYLSLRIRSLAIINRRLDMVACTDSLTNCLNRGAFTARVESQLLEEEGPLAGALLIIDADNFKTINDLHGHDAGDEALTILSRAVRSVLRPGDLIGRLGGEEFGVYLPGIDQRETELMAERIRRAVQQAHFAPRGRPHVLTVSIGGAVFAGAAGFADLFRIADQRLYGAKRSGRNRAVVMHAYDSPPLDLLQSA